MALNVGLSPSPGVYRMYDSALRLPPSGELRALGVSASRNEPGVALDISREVVKVLDEVLRLGERASSMTEASALLGAIPELDSMAVVSILTLLEERFGFVVDDDEMDGSVFATLGALVAFVGRKLDG